MQIYFLFSFFYLNFCVYLLYHRAITVAHLQGCQDHCNSKNYWTEFFTRLF